MVVFMIAWMTVGLWPRKGDETFSLQPDRFTYRGPSGRAKIARRGDHRWSGQNIGCLFFLGFMVFVTLVARLIAPLIAGLPE